MIANVRGSYTAIFLLFLLSGATSLVYEVIWLRQLILIFGSTQFATSTILSTFMAGLALGAFVTGRWLGRTRMRPLRIYGLLEIGIGLYALCVPFLFDQFYWGRRVHSLGVGPKPIPHKELTAERLARTLDIALGDTGMRKRAAELGERIRAEDGVGRAVEVIDGYVL